MRHAPSVVRSAHRAVSIAAALISTALVLTLATTTAPAVSAGSAGTSANKERTSFAFRAVSYGSRVKGGQLPASSGTTSYQAIGCTNLAGTNKVNHAATAKIPGLGVAKGVDTRSWTEKKSGVVSSYSTHDIASLTIGESDFGSLTIKALSSLSRAYHDSSGFHATTRTSIARITFTPSGGAPQELDIPTAKRPIVIPGLLVLALGSEKRRASSTGAFAKADVLDILLVPTNTRVRVAHTGASLGLGVKRGLFSGLSAATQARALDGLVRSGPQPHTHMPCQGTLGKVTGKAIAELTISGVVEVDAASTRQMGQQSARRAWGFEEARIARVDLGAGQLVIKAIVGRANVERNKNGVVANTNGTSILSAVANGETYTFPELDGLEIPGLVRIDTNVKTKIRNGIDVVAVRLTLLDGTGAVVDLGHARLAINRAG